jgi:hypothetical protein
MTQDAITEANPILPNADQWGTGQYGWIQDFKYDPYQGMAEFTLKHTI